jgi:hypothetical protein
MQVISAAQSGFEARTLSAALPHAPVRAAFKQSAQLPVSGTSSGFEQYVDAQAEAQTDGVHTHD